MLQRTTILKNFEKWYKNNNSHRSSARVEDKPPKKPDPSRTAKDQWGIKDTTERCKRNTTRPNNNAKELDQCRLFHEIDWFSRTAKVILYVISEYFFISFASNPLGPMFHADDPITTIKRFLVTSVSDNATTKELNSEPPWVFCYNSYSNATFWTC